MPGGFSEVSSPSNNFYCFISIYSDQKNDDDDMVMMTLSDRHLLYGGFLEVSSPSSCD